MDSDIRLNPNYKPITNFLRLVEEGNTQYTEKMRRLAVDIGNCVWKVRHKPTKILLRRLKKFFISSQWFKKVRIIHNKLYLFRRKGRFAIVLSHVQLYSLKMFAKENRQQKI